MKHNWINKYREHMGKRMYVFDFAKFFEKEKFTFESMRNAIDYTNDGILKMVNRGTMKFSTFDKLQKSTKRNLSVYIIKRKGKI